MEVTKKDGKFTIGLTQAEAKKLIDVLYASMLALDNGETKMLADEIEPIFEQIRSAYYYN